uniref:Uncharacterized protein n=1 Tax=Periophthalmus magnuspinnatus TaxID=409849 RepID=A0A3B4B4Z3_9GOBI
MSLHLKSPSRHTVITPLVAYNVWVVDGEDVTPRPLTHSDPGAPKRSLFLIDEGSDSDSDLGHTETITVYSNLYSLSLLCTVYSLSLCTIYSLSLLCTIYSLSLCTICSLSLLCTYPNHFNVETVSISLFCYRQSNRRYIELCKTKLGNDTFKERGMQTFDNARKTISIQTDAVVTAETGYTFSSY